MLPPLSPQASCHNLKAFDLIIILIFFVTIIIITISIIIIIIYISILPFPPNLTNQIILEHFTLSQSSAEISRNSWSIVGLVGGHWVQMGQVSLKSVKRTTRQATVHFIFPFAQLLTPRPQVITVWGIGEHCMPAYLQYKGSQILEILMEGPCDTPHTHWTKLTKHPQRPWLHQTHHHQNYFHQYHLHQIGWDLGDRKWLCWVCQTGHWFQSTPTTIYISYFSSYVCISPFQALTAALYVTMIAPLSTVCQPAATFIFPLKTSSTSTFLIHTITVITTFTMFTGFNRITS